MKQIQKQILRYPRLDTILMVEKFIQKHDGEFRKKELWLKLPKKMMYQTFCVIIDYLLYSRKISIDAEKKIGWIYYPKNKLDKNLFLDFEISGISENIDDRFINNF